MKLLNDSIGSLFLRKNQKLLSKFNQAGVITIADLLWIFPKRIQPIPHISPFSDAMAGQLFLGQGKVLSVKATPNLRSKGNKKPIIFNITTIVSDKFGKIISIRWFNIYPNQKNQLETIHDITFLGFASEYNNQLQFVNPEIITDITAIPSFMVEYPTLNGIDGSQIRKMFSRIPEHIFSSISSILPPQQCKQEMELSRAFRIIHGHIENGQFTNQLLEKARRRIAFEEVLEEQIKIRIRRDNLKLTKAPVLPLMHDLTSIVQKFFPYQFTDDQKNSINIIQKDCSSNQSMMRLIQGDVGCGKTTVAFAAAYSFSRNKFQVALMAPTETLAQQHYQNFKRYFADTVQVGLLLGSTPKKEKTHLIESIASGKITMVFGTHSLIQDKVQFLNLGLVIIDEQHKFGVNQRIGLTQKGKDVHCLIMTATPIPRSLRLTQYGDLDISTIVTMPQGRKEIKTRIVSPEKFGHFLNFLKARMDLGEQAYIVVPAIEDSENLDLLNIRKVEVRFKQIFEKYKIASIHGKMATEEKNKIFDLFKNGDLNLLISTSIIEVGIDVQNASVIAIMNPERFGLGSLHQLRGRVGRGSLPGFCFLILDHAISAISQQRLEVIEKTTDGFQIAEEDLKIRGEGDLFGTDQSGNISLRKAFLLDKDYDLIEDACAAVNNHWPSLKDKQVLSGLKHLSKDSKIQTTI